ncbi:hypothetical protein ACX1C1_00770 [Paenibacillus sp. strain BS8-2]
MLIESTGIGEPLPVAQTFTYVDEDQNMDLSMLTRLDCMVYPPSSTRARSRFIRIDCSGGRLSYYWSPVEWIVGLTLLIVIVTIKFI